MLTCEGYKMFVGSADFVKEGRPTKTYHGTWLYNPTDCYWYINNCPDYPLGTSFHVSRIQNIREDE